MSCKVHKIFRIDFTYFMLYPKGRKKENRGKLEYRDFCLLYSDLNMKAKIIFKANPLAV